MRFLCSLCVLLLFCSAAFSQQRFLIQGSVLDPTGAAIPAATVSLVRNHHHLKTVTTDARGRYVLNAPSKGNYELLASAPAFVQALTQEVHVVEGTMTQDLTLEIAGDNASITVQGDAPAEISADPNQNASATHLQGKSLEAISDDPDDLVTDVQTLAGPSAGLQGAQVYIDGLTAGDATLPDKASIREIRINQNPFAPEFDSIGLGRIELLTKAGADNFHGGLFLNDGESTFNSSNPYATQKPPFSLRQYGGSFSGPVGRKLAFFFDLNKRDIENGAVVNAVTLDPVTLAIINPYTQVFSSPFRFLRISPRVDYKLTAKHAFMFRYGYTKNDYDHYGVGTFDLVSRAANAHLREHAIQVTATSILSSHVVSETQFLYLHQFHTHQADTNGPTLEVSNAFSGGPDPENNSSYIHHHFQVQNITTIATNKHTLRVGVRLRAVSILDSTNENFYGTFTFGGAFAPTLDADDAPIVSGVTCDSSLSTQAGCETISSIEQYRRTLVFQQQGMSMSEVRALGGGATQFTMSAGQPSLHIGGIDAGIFAGDDWRITPRFTLSYGLRYETQTNIADHADFAPRLGFAWQPMLHKHKDPSTVLRGGFGIFYERFSEANVTTAQRYNGYTQQQYLISDPTFFPNVPAASTLATATGSQVVQTISPSMRAPYLLQSSVGIEQKLMPGTTLAVNYVNSHGIHQLRSRDINAPLAATGLLPLPSQGPIYEMESAGLFNQNQLVANMNMHLAKSVTLFSSYTLNYARSNTDGVTTFPANQYNDAGEYGPAENDIRHRFSLGGSLTPLWGIEWNPLIILQSGTPFNLITSQDIYGTGLLNARPGFATSSSQPGVISTRYGLLDPDPTDQEKSVPRNYGRSPGQFFVNLHLGRDFQFGNTAQSHNNFFHRAYTLNTGVTARNLLNHLNPGPIIGNINSPLFDKSNQIAAGTGAFANSANNRRIEFQIKLGF